MFAGNAQGGKVTLDAGARIASSGADGPVTVVMRPEAVQISPTALRPISSSMAILVDVIYLGVFVKYIVVLPTGQRMTCTIQTPPCADRCRSTRR